MEPKQMIFRKTWKEFRDSGLFWWINMILHTFGWVITFTIDQETDEILDVFPARTKFRSFDEKSNTEGFKKVSRYLVDNSPELLLEAEGD